MPKKKRVPPKAEGGRTPFILRFDSTVYSDLKTLAEEAGVSVNQLMEGVAFWLVQNSKVGKPLLDENGIVIGNQPERGRVWAGADSETVQAGKARSPGVWMQLDFRSRRVLCDDF